MSVVYRYILNMYNMYIDSMSVLCKMKENKLLIHKMLHTLRVDWEIEFGWRSIWVSLR